MTVAIVQSANYPSRSTNGACVLGAAPTVGNLLVAFVTLFQGGTASSGWTIAESVNDANSGTLYLVYRYVQPGDTVNLQIMSPANGSFWNVNGVYELSGVRGDWAHDFGGFESAFVASGSFSTTGLAMAAESLCIAGFESPAENAPLASAPSGFTLDQHDNNNGGYGTDIINQFFSSSGTASAAVPSAQANGTAYIAASFLTPHTTPTVVQHKSSQGSGSMTSFNPTLTSTPIVGNLLVAFVGVNASLSTFTFNTAKWTPFQYAYQSVDQSSLVGVGFYRYVESGDTTSLPPFTTSGSSDFTYSMYEIDGVKGNWTNDAISFNSGGNSNNVSTVSIGALTAATANSLALCGFFQYNGTHNPTISSGWTLDEAGNNFSEYGSWGAASQAISSAGSGVDATITFVDNEGPLGIVGLVLGGNAPANIPFERQHSRYVSNSGTPGQLRLGDAPLPGSLIVAILHWGSGSASGPTIGGSWTTFETVMNGSNVAAVGVYRYAQSGDSALLPTLATGGSQYWAASVMEFSGVSGTFSDDVPLFEGHFDSASSQTTGTETTPVANCIGVIAAAQYDGSSFPSTSSSGWSTDEATANAGAFGSVANFSQYYPTVSSSVDATISYSSSGPSSYIQYVVQAVTPPPPAGGNVVVIVI